MLQIPSRFLTDRESWGGNSEFANAYYDIGGYYQVYNRRLTHLSSAQNVAETVVNPITEILLYMLHRECLQKTSNQVTIRFATAKLEEPYLPDTRPAPLAENSTSQRLNIYLVRYGSPRIPELDKTAEIKALSMVLQRSNQHKIRVFKRNDNNIDIYTNVWSWEIYYKIIALLPALFPTTYKELSEAVIQALSAAANLDINKYQANVTKWFERWDPEKERKLLEMQRFFAGRIDRKISEIKNALTNTDSQIINYYNAIAELNRSREKQNTELLGLEVMKADDTEHVQDILDYISKNKSIWDSRISGETLTLYIETPLKYTDIDAIKHQYIDSNRYGEPATTFLKEVFLEEKYDIMTYSVMQLNLDGNTVTRGTPISNPDRYPHPHIMQHNCWGDNKSHIQKALAKQDIITAIAQCIATNMNLNALDSIVMRGMVNRFIGECNHKTCIKDNTTGERISYLQYLEQLKERSTKHASNNNNTESY